MPYVATTRNSSSAREALQLARSGKTLCRTPPCNNKPREWPCYLRTQDAFQVSYTGPSHEQFWLLKEAMLMPASLWQRRSSEMTARQDTLPTHITSALSVPPASVGSALSCSSKAAILDYNQPADMSCRHCKLEMQLIQPTHFFTETVVPLPSSERILNSSISRHTPGKPRPRLPERCPFCRARETSAIPGPSSDAMI